LRAIIRKDPRAADILTVVFFHRSEKKRAQDDVAQSEIDRLKSLAPDALAIEVLPTLASDALKGKVTGVRVQDICKELLGGFGSTFTVNPGVLLIPVREALQRLEHANLVMQMASGIDNSTRWRITSTGEQSLADGDTSTRLHPATS
jgi:hypothetical protein